MGGQTESLLIEVDGPGEQSLVAGYLARRREQIPVLRLALHTGDFEALWIAGHHMHGAGGSYGVPRISELGAALEVSAFERDVRRIGERINELETYLDRVAIVDRRLSRGTSRER
jgi:HPt (histidine-containing phosphotransfer) domain-containing protein